MNSVTSAPYSPTWLTVTPHRALFAVGGANLLLSMLWWALWLADARWRLLGLPQAPLYPGWVHAFVLPYLVLAPFMYGFLFTVFPRWMPVPGYNRWHFLPTGGSLLLAQLLVLGSLWWGPLALHLGLLLGLTGWSHGLILLLDRLRQDPSRCWHARSIAAAMTLGWVGMAALFLHQLWPQAWLVPLALKLGVVGLLLPVYLTVAHRMFPFFAQMAVRGYQPWRPLWLLAALWPLLLGHLLLELGAMTAWLWLVDLPLAALGALMLRRWWPPASAPLILRALFIGMLWFPLGAALYSLQSLLAAFDVYALGRAPLHAWTVGLFGSLLVAMVSRVSKGHSGRAMEMNRIDRIAFVAIQLVALLRIAAELRADTLAWNALAAFAWVAVLLPWLLQCAAIWSSARVDGKPG